MKPTSDGDNVLSNGTPTGSSNAGIGEGDNKPSVLVSLNRLFCNTAQGKIMLSNSTRHLWNLNRSNNGCSQEKCYGETT